GEGQGEGDQLALTARELVRETGTELFDRELLEQLLGLGGRRRRRCPPGGGDEPEVLGDGEVPCRLRRPDESGECGAEGAVAVVGPPAEPAHGPRRGAT